MRETRHFSLRTQQRRIEDFEVRLTMTFGMAIGCKRCLSEKSCRQMLRALDLWERHLAEGSQNGGLMLSQVTANREAYCRP